MQQVRGSAPATQVMPHGSVDDKVSGKRRWVKPRSYKGYRGYKSYKGYKGYTVSKGSG